MHLEPALRALAAALAGEGPAVQLGAPATAGGDPALDLIPREAWAGAMEGVAGENGIAAVVATSGSTGLPKRTLLSVDALAASSIGTALALGAEGQWLLALPAHYVAGLQVLVRSLFAGTRPVTVDLRGGFTARAFTEAAEELTDRVRFTSLVPTQLNRLLADPEPRTRAVLRRFQAILLGGAPAGPALLAAAREAGVRVVTTYGASETCGGCVYDGVPLEGVQVAVRDDRVWLGGDVLASGYLEDDRLTREAFSTEETPAGSARWYRTGDLGALDADGRLEVLGRADDVIISGGLKVPATTVAAALSGVPGVVEVFVGPVADEQWGQRVAAAVVGHCSKAELLAAARLVLEAHMVPKTVVFVSELPALSTGKPDRTAILALLAEAAGAGN